VHHEHSCMRAHGERRQRRAIAALASYGVTPPAGWAQ
jgi:hypothetical protein